MHGALTPSTNFGMWIHQSSALVLISTILLPSKAGATITDTCTAMPDDARRFPLIPENQWEFPITNGVGYAISGNGYTTALVRLAGGHVVDDGIRKSSLIGAKLSSGSSIKR